MQPLQPAPAAMPSPVAGPFTTQRDTVHDLRNLFAVISSAGHLMKRPSHHISQEALLKAIEVAAMRGGALTTSLLGTGPTCHAAGGLDLNAHINTIAPMVRALCPEISINTCDGSLFVPATPDVIEAVIVELLTNAKAAGAIRPVLRTRRIGARALLQVADDGCGMAQSMIRPVKGQACGQGEHGGGWPRIRAFADQTHARICIRSRAGTGTLVSINLPTVLRATTGKPDADTPRLALTAKENAHETI